MTRLVTVRALKSFDGFKEDELYQVAMTESTAHLIVNNYLQLLHDPAWSNHGLDVPDQPDISGGGVA